MNIKSHQLFAQLCESIVFEDSTAMDLVGQLPGGSVVIKALHQIYDLAHDVMYQPVEKVSWSELKQWGNNKDYAWVIIKYPKGVGAIREDRGDYIAVASTGGPIEEILESHGGTVMNWLKSKLGGNPRSYYKGTQSRGRRELVKQRAELKKISNSSASVESLTKKFKPLWVKACGSAIADVKGMVGIMLKNDSFDKAGKKIETLKRLTDMLRDLENNPNDVPTYIERTVNDAVVLSASHYYPDETGTINRSYRLNRSDRSTLNPSNSKGTEMLLKDIAQGDQAKLGTILAFFKQRLMAV